MGSPPPSSRGPFDTGLLSTKLCPPHVRAEHIPRPHLLARLQTGITRPLTLLAAPAGSGKTSLLASWLAERMQDAGRGMKTGQSDPASFAWLSLDPGDNDPMRFLAYLVAALTHCDEELGRVLAGLLPVPPAGEGLLVALVNAIAAAPPFVLVLDDYHTIADGPVHGLVAGLLEQAPAPLHLVISTRADPPLPLARLRARGALTELRAADLRFSNAEAAALIAGVSQISLTSPQVARLADRTEGWAAGLQLAALALYRCADIDLLVTRFSGSHQYVLDYLVEEVLAHQPRALQDFLLQTSILDRMCVELCDAVVKDEGRRMKDEDRTTGSDQAQSFITHPSSLILQELERANLFIIPLDDERRWYRYHHLFAELLRLRLQQAHPELVIPLHRRASAWFEEHGLHDETIHHALAGADIDRAARLMAQLAPFRIYRGELLTVQGWFAALPADLVAMHPHLLMARCWLLWVQSQIHALEELLGDLDRVLARAPAAEPPIYIELRVQAALLRSYLARRRGSHEEALASAQEALALAPASNVMLRGLAAIARSHIALDAGDVAQAAAGYRQGLEAIWAVNITVIIPGITNYLSQVLLLQGQLAAAEALCRETLRRIAAAGWEATPQAGAARIALAEVLREQDQLVAAEELALRGLEQSRRGAFFDEVRVGAICLARVRLARGDLASIPALLEEAAHMAELLDLPWVDAEVAAARVRLALALGDVATARTASARLAGLAVGAPPLLQERAALTAAHLALVEGDYAGALTWLSPTIAAAEAAGRMRSLIEGLALRARAWAGSGDAAQAARDRTRAEELALHLGFAHPSRMKDEGRRMNPDSAPPGEPGLHPSSFIPHSLAEPLSDRELEVLRLLAAGRSNRAIAAALTIAEGTVKSHIHHIYGKLGVDGRVAAVTRARELGLI